ncbi:hypothetical protein G7A66_07745 [Altererythrobacter sp. SALINAS58]|uniref:hypothetical protein n=1 Tax=Alteripontixanthobacter muriae TaxID=2705546 RepID=UPI0015756031|nr:hypothetical protein [Alteripontixanthobacter muriae]NTZ42981.1 hypothetical protein [Alteripontixanthobacter muriae]
MSVPLAFQGVERLQVLCLLQGENGVAPPVERDRLCDAVVSEASRASPVPVTAIALGDPQVLAPGSLTILTHGSIAGDGGERVLVLAMRPYRVTGGQSDILFGAPPQVIRFDDDPARKAAIGKALDELLPWCRGETAAKRITE